MHRYLDFCECGENDYAAHDTRITAAGAVADLLFSVFNAGPGRWIATVWASIPQMHRLDGFECQSFTGAEMWCNRLNRIDIQGGEYDEAIDELYA